MVINSPFVKHAHTHLHICTSVRTHTHTHTHANIHTHKTHTHTHIHTHTCAHTHTHTHTCTRTHKEQEPAYHDQFYFTVNIIQYYCCQCLSLVCEYGGTIALPVPALLSVIIVYTLNWCLEAHQLFMGQLRW